MQTVRQLLASKSKRDPITVGPDVTVYQALQALAEHDIGAVLVVENDAVVGIFSERDYARRIVLQGRTSASTPVCSIMTSRVLYVGPDNTLDDCMALMTEQRIRHLPVLEDARLIGLLSIGDLVRATIDEQKVVIDHLVHYIQGA
ncbi:CBS domain-containing protein [Paludibacterium yongneupense]|uniref:CBS domain-containing protein n=1 Tax=Paludibacterium yongneupense TaxID=400061 RepID=UPI000401AB3E|nr:CBS domain-containing protein [Paludibacterium yongneupense]